VPGPALERLRRSPVAAALAGEPAAWIVGGAVRDALLGRPPAEVDVVVEGDAVAVARRAAERLGGHVVAHDRFGTATVRAGALVFDVAATRAETYARPGALPDVTLGAPLAADLARRDFTVNAMAVRIADGELTAWPGAEDDLGAGVLRVLHDAAFIDDPTRLLRLARYTARLGFTPEPSTAELAAAAVADGALETVSGARLGAELRRLLREPQPAAMVAVSGFGLGATLLPGFAPDPEFVARALAACPDDGRGDLVALAACLRLPPGPVRRLADRLAFPAGDRAVLAASTARDGIAAALAPEALAPSGVREVLRRRSVELAALVAAGGGRAGERAARWIAEWRHVEPAITGHDLLAAGLEGPAVGAGLEAAIAARLDGRAPDRAAQLAVALAAARPGGAP